MKRRGMFAGLLGMLGGVAARGQARRPSFIDDIAGEAHKPKNNECPVCGTMAPVSKMEVHFENCESAWQNRKNMVHCRPVFEPGWNFIRCAFCNCAFYQDQERPVSQ